LKGKPPNLAWQVENATLFSCFIGPKALSRSTHKK
jgi:hypothetical protein